jgi:surface protein
MSEMFSGADSFNSDISGWNVSKVVNMNEMFSPAESFNQDLSSWNVENVESCKYFDDGCEGESFVVPNFTKCSI